MRKKENQLVFYIGLLPFVMVLGNSMLIPLIPNMEKDLHLHPFETGLILSMFSIPAAVVIPFIGFLSDRFGRKQLIISSLWIVIFGSILCGISGMINDSHFSFQILLVGRVIQGIGAGGTTPLAMSLVGDIFSIEKRGKALGILEVFNGIGKVVAPILGAFAAIWNWYIAFFFFPVVAIISLKGIINFVPSAKVGKDILNLRDYFIKLSTVLKHNYQLLLPLYFIGGTGLFLLFGILFYLSYQIEIIYKIDGFFKGFVFAFPLGALTITSYWTGNRLKKDPLQGKNYFTIGMFLLIIMFLLLIYFHHFQLLLLFITLAFSGLGFILPCINIFITTATSDAERGFIVSLYGTSRFLGVALGPIVFGYWMNNSRWMFLYGFILLLLCFSIYIFMFYIKDGLVHLKGKTQH